ncbi:uncharacterized protein LOC134852057 [Symsagittifera roscoffensis]|uniref:uncharacterized protein LOC134852057 n=1 Tax=Symsagittifera roscoffensis TaxID=84072 RepID=UPI00307C924A
MGLLKNSNLAVFLNLIFVANCCYVCEPDKIRVPSPKLRVISFGPTNKIVSSSEMLSDFIIETKDGVVSEDLCGSMCLFHSECKSLNFNTRTKRCNLLATDVNLKNITGGIGTTTGGDWIHRSAGGLPRGCPDGAVVLRNCTSAWVDSATTSQIVVHWKYPSDADEQSGYLVGSQDLVIENEADVGQSEVMNSDVVVFSGVSAIERRYVFDSLIPGMRYNIIIQAFFKNSFKIQVPLQTEETVEPARPALKSAESFEKSMIVNWTLEGVADNYHIWNTPGDGICAGSLEGYCEVDVQQHSLQISELVAGEATSEPQFLNQVAVNSYPAFQSITFANPPAAFNSDLPMSTEPFATCSFAEAWNFQGTTNQTSTQRISFHQPDASASTNQQQILQSWLTQQPPLAAHEQLLSFNHQPAIGTPN